MPATYTLTRATGNGRVVHMNISQALLKVMFMVTYNQLKTRVNEPFPRQLLIQIGEIWAQSPDLRPPSK